VKVWWEHKQPQAALLAGLLKLAKNFAPIFVQGSCRSARSSSQQRGLARKSQLQACQQLTVGHFSLRFGVSRFLRLLFCFRNKTYFLLDKRCGRIKLRADTGFRFVLSLPLCPTRYPGFVIETREYFRHWLA
jgi:hypothetical protein